MTIENRKSTTLEIKRIHQRAAHSRLRGVDDPAQLKEWFGPENVRIAILQPTRVLEENIGGISSTKKAKRCRCLANIANSFLGRKLSSRGNGMTTKIWEEPDQSRHSRTVRSRRRNGSAIETRAIAE